MKSYRFITKFCAFSALMAIGLIFSKYILGRKIFKREDISNLNNHRLLQNETTIKRGSNQTKYSLPLTERATVSTNGYTVSNFNCSILKSSQKTSPSYSRIQLIKTTQTNNSFNVLITASSKKDFPKHIGGDLFIVWAEQLNGDGRAPGWVTDLDNGTYLGQVKIYWGGKTVIKAKLLSTAEKFCYMKNAMDKYGNSGFAMKRSIAIYAVFQKGLVKDESLCGTIPNLPGYDDSCNFTKLNGDSEWFCGKPIQLSCSDIIALKTKSLERDKLAPTLNKNEILTSIVHGALKDTVVVQSESEKMERPIVTCHKLPKDKTWSHFGRSGYFKDGLWHSVECKRSIKFSEATYKHCLKNKTLAMFGDSTVREIVDYFLKYVLALSGIDLKTLSTIGKTYHSELLKFTKEFTVIYKKHEMPFRTKLDFEGTANGINSVPNEIRDLADGPIPGKELIILVTYGAHLQDFPLSSYRYKVKRLASAIEYLLQMKPESSVFIKGPHVYFRIDGCSDHRITLMQNEIMFQELENLRERIIYLDIWSITVAHNSEAIHPHGNAFKSQIQQLMSYVCSV